MGDGTKIEWTDATVNAVNGCSVVSPGCTNCYAMRLAGTRLRNHPTRAGLTIDTKAGPVWNGEVRLNETALLQPLRWRRPRMIFWNAHGDLFHPSVPDSWIDRQFATMALTPQHIHQVLTKRGDRAREYLTRLHDEPARETARRFAQAWPPREQAGYVPTPADGITIPLPNVWLGVSVEDQKRANERIPDLLATPAAVRFLSCEPLLGPVDLTWVEFPNDRGGMECWDALDLHEDSDDPMPSDNCRAVLDWVICGGESGPKARPMHPDWARSLRDQCAAAGAPFFFKQIGEWGWPTVEQHHADYAAACNGEGPWPGDYLLDREGARLPGTSMQVGSRIYIRKMGKKAAGRLLDGVTHDGMPA